MVIDGGDLLVEDNNDGTCVGNLTTTMQRIAEHYGCAFIITTGSGKWSAKAIKDGAERRSITKGSEVWGRTGGTVFSLNSEHDGTENTRRLIIQHRNAATERFLLNLENGRLVKVDEAVEQETADNRKLTDWLFQQDRFTLNDFRRDLKLSGGTAKRRLDGLVDSGLVVPHESKGRQWYEIRRAGVE